ncbi:MAG: hypothetical protein ISR57_08325 [Bacteroidales bacterium]|nr:hypothetical protein [Bacteroidota bacterium]MBL6950632.1 hypothetical protein [Bacteroidales bacterium]
MLTKPTITPDTWRQPLSRPGEKMHVEVTNEGKLINNNMLVDGETVRIDLYV